MTKVENNSVLNSQPIRQRLDGHFLTCSAALAGVAVILPVAPASGEIVYSGIFDLPIQATGGGLYFDLESPFTTTTNVTFPGWDINPYTFGQRIYVHSNVSLVLENGNAANLPLGTTVSSASAFSGTSFSGGVNIPADDTGYVAFRFDPDGVAGAQTYYGWYQLAVGSAGSGDGKVIDWAYEDTGAPIQVGAGAVPEPGSLALLAFGAAGLVSRRRRRAA